jgi:hypothetical protein
MKKNILLAAIASVLTLLIVLLAGEVYLRYRTNDLIRSYAQELHTHDGRKISFVGPLKLGLAPFTVYNNLPSQRTPVFTINSHGLRAEEGAEQDPGPKIVFLGGSAAFGYGARSNQETIPYIVERSMKSYRVLNSGVVGFLSGQELTHLVTQLIDYRPTMVVAYDGWNDLFDAIFVAPDRKANELGFNSNFFQYEDHLILNIQNALSRLVEAIGQKSRVYAGIHQAFAEYRHRKALSDQFLADPTGSRNKILLDSIVEKYTGNLRKMSLFSRASGAEFVAVFQPELGQRLKRTPEEEKLLRQAGGIARYQDEFPLLYREFLGKTKQQLTRDGVEWIDVNESPDYQQSTASLFIDVVHTNVRGNEIVADVISRRLQLLINAKSRPSEKSGPQVPPAK